jgi:hypothetical protein
MADVVASTRPRKLDDSDRQAIRGQLTDGVPRLKIAIDLEVSLRQVDAIRAHVTMSERREPLTPEQMLNRAYSYARARAKVKNLACLTQHDCAVLWETQGGKCAVSGQPFSNWQAQKGSKVLSRPWRPSLDRIDSRKGYEKRNVRLVSQIVNMAIGEWPFEVFVDMCRRVAATNS